jgi:hypothetical protein
MGTGAGQHRGTKCSRMALGRRVMSLLTRIASRRVLVLRGQCTSSVACDRRLRRFETMAWVIIGVLTRLTSEVAIGVVL